MIIDANNLILGRMASYAAKKALLGEKIDIVNCEKCVVIGNKKDILSRYKKRMQRGIHSKGPFLPKNPDMFVKRGIRGMLPHKIKKGREAYERIKCYAGIPEKFSKEKIETVKNIDVSKTRIVDCVRVKDICSFLGGKV